MIYKENPIGPLSPPNPPPNELDWFVIVGKVNSCWSISTCFSPEPLCAETDLNDAKKRLEFSKILHERLSADKLGNQDPYMIEDTLQ